MKHKSITKTIRNPDITLKISLLRISDIKLNANKIINHITTKKALIDSNSY